MVENYLSAKINHGNTEQIVSFVVSNERQHSPTADDISHKWGCIITANNNIVSNTTQDWIMLSVLDLMKQYHTDLQFQNLCFLQTIFYTDTLFPKVKSITGHEYYHIYTNRKLFVVIMLLFSKSEVGM